MPSATTGPIVLIDPPSAATPLTVSKARTVSKSQTILPFFESYARRWPSIDVANTAPGISATAPGWAWLHPLVARQAGLGGGVDHKILPLSIARATTPPPDSAWSGFQSEIA